VGGRIGVNDTGLPFNSALLSAMPPESAATNLGLARRRSMAAPVRSSSTTPIVMPDGAQPAVGAHSTSSSSSPTPTAIVYPNDSP